jgi:hypothetical protein
LTLGQDGGIRIEAAQLFAPFLPGVACENSLYFAAPINITSHKEESAIRVTTFHNDEKLTDRILVARYDWFIL